MQIYIVRDGQRFGPYSVDQLRSYLQSNELVPSDLAWREGMTELEPLETLLAHIGQPVQHPVGLIDPQKMDSKAKASDKKGTMPIILPEGLTKLRSQYGSSK